MSVLDVTEVEKRFGGITALSGVEMEIEEGEILGIIGPNGAGKSTLVNIITGLLEPNAGRVRLNGEEITGLPTHKISHRGVSKTFQRVTLFPGQTTFECLLTGIQEHRNKGLMNKLRPHSAEERKLADEMVEFLGLEHLRDEEVENLSFGQQKLVDFGVALISDPDIALLDEPVSGVNPTMVSKLEESIIKQNEQGTTFVIIEHNIELVMRLCERIVVLNNGSVLFEGSPEEVKQEKSVIEAYFGGDDA